MKKRTLALILALVLMLSLAGCGGAAKSESAYVTEAAPAAPRAPMEEPMPEPEAAYDYDYTGNGVAPDGGETASEPAQGQDGAGISDYAEKLIYSAFARIETLDYDATVQGVYDMIAKYGGFLESSSISGSDYYSAARGYTNYRSASFALRIPSESFKEVTENLSDLGNVPYCNTYTENVTTSYYDTQSRLTAYETQETRLLELLEMAETVEDILLIQAQLTDVQYEIDSLETTLRIYDRQVAYSTLQLEIQEVEEYTEEPTVVVSYWERMTKGFARTLKNVGEFFTDLFLWIVVNLPTLIVIAVILAVIIIIIRRIVKKRRENPDRAPSPRRQRKLAKKQARLEAKQAKNSKPEE